MDTQTQTEIKEPAKFLSHKTNNPNKNRCYYFINPLVKLLPEHEIKGEEKYMERQKCKTAIIDCINKLVIGRKISLDKSDELTKQALEDMENQFAEERNKELLNPAWIEYREKNAKTTSGRNKNKADLEKDEIKKILKENEQLKAQVEELKLLLSQLGSNKNKM